jgi:hypothetical protein
MYTQEPFLAEERNIEEMDSLLCSAQAPISLSEQFCTDESRPGRLIWFQGKVAHELLWVIRDDNGLAGLLILEQDLFARVVGIEYIVVAERMRGRKEIGPRLVQRAQTLERTDSLKAEARNRHSCRLLKKCGFLWENECSSAGYPILRWSRS